jgi:hypothetical protein
MRFTALGDQKKSAREINSFPRAQSYYIKIFESFQPKGLAAQRCSVGSLHHATHATHTTHTTHATRRHRGHIGFVFRFIGNHGLCGQK